MDGPYVYEFHFLNLLLWSLKKKGACSQPKSIVESNRTTKSNAL